jgi:hypothetical protein
VSETQRFESFDFQNSSALSESTVAAGRVVRPLPETLAVRVLIVIERRPFLSLSGYRGDWLDAKHHFPHEHARSGWGALRVWNDDEIAPNSGFPPHAHANMEIITYVRDGALNHRDSLGNEGRIAAGDVQVMSAGRASSMPSSISSRIPRAYFKSGLSRKQMAVFPYGARSRSRRETARIVSLHWRVASQPMATRCRFELKHACLAPR